MLFIAAYYSHPNAEDLSLIGAAKNMGILNSSYMLLATYDGRYFTNLLHGFNPLVLGWVDAYKYTVSFSILFFISCLVLFVKSIYPKLKWFKVLLFSALVVLLNFSLSPSLVHQLYWLVSSYVYLYAWCFWLLWVSSYLYFMRAQNSTVKSILYFITNILLFLAIGINEMFLVLNLATLVVLVGYHSYKHQFKLIENLPILITFTLSFMLFASSPGILSRVDSLDVNPSSFAMIKSGFNGLKHYSISLAHILLFNVMIIPTLILIGSDFFQLSKIKLRASTIAMILILGLAVIYGMTLAYYLLMGTGLEEYPNRIFTSIYTGIIFLVLVGVAPLIVNSINQLQFPSVFIQLVQSLSIVMVGVGLYFGNNNIHLIQQELESGLIQAYDEDVRTQYATIAAAKNKQSCWTTAVIQDLNNLPVSIFMTPKIQENRIKPYWNNAYEAYFLIDEIRIKKDTVTKLENTKNIVIVE